MLPEKGSANIKDANKLPKQSLKNPGLKPHFSKNLRGFCISMPYISLLLTEGSFKVIIQTSTHFYH
jgi:hypothetical protein